MVANIEIGSYGAIDNDLSYVSIVGHSSLLVKVRPEACKHIMLCVAPNSHTHVIPLSVCSLGEVFISLFLVVGQNGPFVSSFVYEQLFSFFQFLESSIVDLFDILRIRRDTIFPIDNVFEIVSGDETRNVRRLRISFFDNSFLDAFLDFVSLVSSFDTLVFLFAEDLIFNFLFFLMRIHHAW